MARAGGVSDHFQAAVSPIYFQPLPGNVKVFRIRLSKLGGKGDGRALCATKESGRKGESKREKWRNIKRLINFMGVNSRLSGLPSEERDAL